MLQKGTGYNTIPLSFDALGLVGYKAGDCFTVKEALERFAQAGIQLSSDALRKGLKAARSLGLLATRIHNNKQRGAPVTLYRLSSMQLIAEKLGVVIGAIDTLTRKAVSSLKNYCAHLHHEFIKRVPGTYGRTWLGNRLGKSARSTYNYEKQFDDIEVIPQFLETPITWADIDTIPELPESGPVYLRVWREVPYTPEEIAERTQHIAPAWRSLIQSDTYLKQFKLPFSQYFVRRELAAGNFCERVQQSANYYRVCDYPTWSDLDNSRDYTGGEYADFVNVASPSLSTERGSGGEVLSLDTIINDNQYLNTPSEIWKAIIQQMQLQLDAHSFQTWLQRAELVDYDDGIFVIEAHNQNARDMLEYRLGTSLWYMLNSFGGDGLSLLFVCAEQSAQDNGFLLAGKASIEGAAPYQSKIAGE